MSRYNGNFTKALKHYKGTINNYKSYNITMQLYKRLKETE